MAETVEETVEPTAAPAPVSRLCLCEQYVRVTEGAALTAARWLGRADQDAAERDAAEAMRRVLDDFPIEGRVVIGSADEESPLRVGEDIGAGGETVDLALDPLEGRGVVARGGNGAMSMIAVGEPVSLLRLPDMYVRTMAVGPRAPARSRAVTSATAAPAARRPGSAARRRTSLPAACRRSRPRGGRSSRGSQRRWTRSPSRPE